MGINNRHHYTNYTDACASDGVGCDGFFEDGHHECDCVCHGEYAPEFNTNDDVVAFHTDETTTDAEHVKVGDFLSAFDNERVIIVDNASREFHTVITTVNQTQRTFPKVSTISVRRA